MRVLLLLSLFCICFANRAAYDPSQHKGPIRMAQTRDGSLVNHGALDLQATYGTSSMGAGAGKTIATMVFGGAYTVEADLLAYSLQYGLPICSTENGCFRRVNASGHPVLDNSIGQDPIWELEANMDVQVMHAIAPGANILVVCADGSASPDGKYWDWEVAMIYAAQNVDYVSTSFSNTESGWVEAYLQRWFEADLAEAVANGASVFAASGDCGYKDASNGQQYPASSPSVIAVGGTTVWESADGSIVQEDGWSGSGGGCSIEWHASAAQMAYPGYDATGCNGWRAVPDIAALGNNNGGVWVYSTLHGGWGVYGGTSLSAPLMTARALLSGLHFTPDLIYGDSGMIYRDILNCASNGYSCAPGYDMITGVGSWIGYLPSGSVPATPMPATPVPATPAPATPAPATPAPTTPPPASLSAVTKHLYMGCYVDGPSRTLPDQVTNTDGTIEGCISACLSKNDQFAGLQASFQCFCGNETYDGLGQAPETDCSYTCSGNPSEICGGSWRNSVYRTSDTTSIISNYLGCYVDDNNRALPNQISGFMSAQECRSGCASAGYSVSGSQNGGQCFCGDRSNLGSSEYPLVSDDQCNFGCGVDATQMCGGSWRNSVWAASA